MLKIKQKMISIFIALAVLLVTVTMGLASVFATPTPVMAAEGTWTLVTDANSLATDVQVIIAAKEYNYALSTTQNSNNRGQASVTKNGDTITFGNDVQLLTLKEGTTSGTFAFNTGSGYLYAASSSSNYLRTETTLSANSSWEITIAADGTATIIAQGTYTRNTMQYNQSSSLFACYSSESQKAICLYKLVETTGGEGGDEPACEHANTTTTTTDATCTEAGSTVVTCEDCGETVSTETIPTLEHKYTETSRKEAECEVAGEITYTCDDCGGTKTESLDALEHNYVDGVCSVCGEEEPSSNITELIFELGANGSATHSDGSTATDYSETVDGYTLSLTSGGQMYKNARDAKGNSCIKLGSSKNTGSFSFTVPNDVTSVIIAVAKYKTNSTDITVNDTSYTLTKNSDNGEYDSIEIDTSITKTVSFTTVSSGARAMINSITYVIDNSMADCAHETTELHNNEDGTHTLICADCENPQGEAEPCTAENYGEYTSNNNSTHTQTGICDCGATITKTEECSFDEGIVTPPTQTEQGYTTYTCENCGYSYQDDVIPALGVETFTVTYYANGNTDEQKYEQNSTTTLPTADTETANDGFVFIGWTTEQYNAQTVPEGLLKAGENFLIDDNKTLYAVYEKNIYGLVTDAANLAAGDKVVIAAKDSAVALSTTQKENNRGQASVTKNGDTITFGSDVQVLTLEAGKTSGTFAFNTGSGYLCAASSSSNYLRTETTLSDNSSWTIEITTSGVATIKAQGEYTRNWLRYNSTSSLFSCYGSGQKDICLYKHETLYTTAPPKIDTASITVGESLSMNYYVILPDAYSSATMRFTLDGKTVENINGEKQTDGRYKFTFVNIPPQCIAENITAAVVYNESEIAKLENYSIATYVNNQLEKIKDSTEDKDAKLRNLLNSILAYGEAAKNYCAENGSQGASEIPESANVFNIVNADLTNKEVKSYVVWFTGANLLFDYDNKICVTLSSTENVKLRVKINDGEYTDYTPTSTAFLTDGILPTAFDSVYTFELYYDGVLMQTLTYSVNSYAYKMQKNGKIGALCVALYNYGVAAEAYQA